MLNAPLPAPPVELFHLNKPSLRFQRMAWSQKRTDANDARIRRVVCAVPQYIMDFLDCVRWEHKIARHKHPTQRRLRELWNGEIVEVYAVEKCPEEFGMPLSDFRALRAAGARLVDLQRHRGPLSAKPCPCCGHVTVTQ